MTETTTPEVETVKTETETVDVSAEQQRLRIFGESVLRRRTDLKLSRNALAALAGLTGAQLWRCEDGRARRTEETALTEALEKLETEGVPAELQPKRREPTGKVAELEAKLRRIDVLLAQALAARSRKESDALVNEAQLVISGEPQQTETEAPAE